MLANHISEYNHYDLFCKWGLDGASGQSTYKQRYESLDDSNNDSSIFMSNLVPIELRVANSDVVIWHNERSSSTRFCRPIKFEFKRETTEVIKEEVEEIESQIRSIIPSKCDNGITVNHTMVMTMVDGKVCNAVTDTTSTMRCYICNITSKDTNNLQKVYSIPTKNENLKFGISPLHARIRCMECLLHISYNLPFKKWKAVTQEQIQLKKDKKALLQNKFKIKLGLIIDVVKQGTTNDGNTARRFFENPTLTAEITGLDESLIRRFVVILQAIASGEKINVVNFSAYAKETAELYVHLYNWYYMPITVHKILIHGVEIIKYAILPIGQLSEEAQEANNKKFKMYRERHSRKMSRLLTNKDILNSLLIASDPLISSLQGSMKVKNKKKPLSEEVKNLLICDITEENE